MSEYVGIGSIIVVGLALFIVAFAMVSGTISYLYQIFDEYIDRRAEERAIKKMKDCGMYIEHESYWFSENDAARAMMIVLGRRIKENGKFYGVSNMRDEWRQMLENINNEREDFE
jgi:hypothetical protein